MILRLSAPRRPCRFCDMLFEDPGPGARDAPAGYCSSACREADRPVKPAARSKASGPRRSTSKRRRRAISPAAPEQRAKVKAGACLVTGATEGVDPAHLTARAHGGCDDPLCIVGLRRDVHEAFDRRELDLLPHLIAHGRHEEIAHAVVHAKGDLVAVLERLTGESWRPVERRVA